MSSPAINNNPSPTPPSETDMLMNMIRNCNPHDPAVAYLVMTVSNEVTKHEMEARNQQAQNMSALAHAQKEATDLKTASIQTSAGSQMSGAVGSAAMSGMQTMKEGKSLNELRSAKSTYTEKLAGIDQEIAREQPQARDSGVETNNPRLAELKERRAELVRNNDHDMHQKRAEFEKSGAAYQALGSVFHSLGGVGQGLGQSASENAENAKTMTQGTERSLADAQKSSDGVVDSQQGLVNALAAQVKASVGA